MRQLENNNNNNNRNVNVAISQNGKKLRILLVIYVINLNQKPDGIVLHVISSTVDLVNHILIPAHSLDMLCLINSYLDIYVINVMAPSILVEKDVTNAILIYAPAAREFYCIFIYIQIYKYIYMCGCCVI